MKKQIIPAILVKTFSDLEFYLARSSQISSFVQIDFCDGEYVKSKTWPFLSQTKSEFLKSFENNQDLYLPFWEDLNYIADLMCLNPLEFINPLANYGFSEIVFHFESLKQEFENKKETFKTFENYLQEIFLQCKNFEINVLIAISSKTNFPEFLETFKTFENEISGIQIMGIENIGIQRQSFSEKTLEIIKDVRKSFTNINIFIDGGMNTGTIPLCFESGANFFVVGSALDLGNDDYIFNYKNFLKLLK
jgi:pentose-5-phosphate-3-epimerase